MPGHEHTAWSTRMQYKGKVGKPTCQNCSNYMNLSTIMPTEKEKFCKVSFSCSTCNSAIEFLAELRGHFMYRNTGVEMRKAKIWKTNPLHRMLTVGTLLIIETGEYSDHNYGGPVKVLKDFIKKDVVEQFKAEWKPSCQYVTEPEPGDFLPWLVSKGYVEAVDCEMWHVGSYGNFRPDE